MSMKMPECPMCGTRLVYPDKPVVEVRGGTCPINVIAGIACSKCPATIDVRQDTGHLVCFRPNQPIKVRRVP